MDIFDPRDLEAHLVGLTKLKQLGYLETYIYEFLKLSIMISDLTMTKIVYMFIDGMVEPLHGFVKSTRPTMLQEAMERARDL